MPASATQARASPQRHAGQANPRRRCGVIASAGLRAQASDPSHARDLPARPMPVASFVITIPSYWSSGRLNVFDRHQCTPRPMTLCLRRRDGFRCVATHGHGSKCRTFRVLVPTPARRHQHQAAHPLSALSAPAGDVGWSRSPAPIRRAAAMSCRCDLTRAAIPARQYLRGRDGYRQSRRSRSPSGQQRVVVVPLVRGIDLPAADTAKHADGLSPSPGRGTRTRLRPRFVWESMPCGPDALPATLPGCYQTHLPGRATCRP